MSTISQTASTAVGPDFTVGVPELLGALTALGLAVRTRPFVPVLGGVLVTADEQGITLATFDYDTAVRVQLTDAPQEHQGAFLISLAELQKLIKAAIKGESKREQATMLVRFTSEITTGVQLVKQKDTFAGSPVPPVEVPYERADVTLHVSGFELPIESLPREDYPKLPALPQPHELVFTAPTASLLDAWQRTDHARGIDDTLPMIIGHRWELADNQLTMACTNRFRLVATNSLVAQSGQDFTAVLPAVAGKALKLLGEQVQFSLSGGWATFAAGNLTISVGLMVVDFPRFRQLFPVRKDATRIVRVSRTELVKLITKAAGMTARVSQVNVEIGQDELVVVPKVESTRPVKGARLAAEVTGDPLRIGFTSEHLLGVLEAVGGEEVYLSINDPNRPLTLARTLSGLFAEQEIRALVMPVRLAE